eukprot:SAG31_NODE_3129_length_4646_cov_2.581262_6_plen_78_part_00
MALSRLAPGFSVRTWEIQREKSQKNQKVTVDFSVRIWEIQEEKSHKKRQSNTPYHVSIASDRASDAGSLRPALSASS